MLHTLIRYQTILLSSIVRLCGSLPGPRPMCRGFELITRNDGECRLMSDMRAFEVQLGCLVCQMFERIFGASIADGEN